MEHAPAYFHRLDDPVVLQVRHTVALPLACDVAHGPVGRLGIRRRAAEAAMTGRALTLPPGPPRSAADGRAAMDEANSGA